MKVTNQPQPLLQDARGGLRTEGQEVARLFGYGMDTHKGKANSVSGC